MYVCVCVCFHTIQAEIFAYEFIANNGQKKLTGFHGIFQTTFSMQIKNNAFKTGI